MPRPTSTRIRSMLALIATAASLVAIPSASSAATCQSWGGQPPSIGDEWSGLDDVVVISACRAFAVGTFRHGGVERALIERWNGTRWSIVELPGFGAAHDGLESVAAAAADDVWAVGNVITDTFEDRPLILRWRGASWSRVPAPATGDSRLYGIDVVAPNDIWAVGQRYDGVANQPLVERWNGKRWKVVPTPELADGGSLYAVDANGPGAAWAVGRREVNGQDVPLTMRWNGTQWRVRPAPTIDDTDGHELRDVVTLSGSKAWAVGYVAGTAYRDLLFRWNGIEWKVAVHPEGEGGGQLLAIEATSANNIWAVGAVCDLGGRCDSRVLNFGGSTWAVQPSPTFGDGSSLSGIDASSPTNAWAVGTTSAPSTFTPFAVHCC